LQVIAVGLGEPKHAERYCGKLAPGLPCLTSTANDPYYAYGIQRGGIKQIFNPNLYKASMQAALAGHTQGQATGDVGMMPGTFVVDRDGIIRYAYYSVHAGDHPAFSTVIKAVQSLA
jgi:hypothetical protein